MANTKTNKLSIYDRVKGVKDHCVSNYENGWCDMVIETLSDWEIANIIENTNTIKGAVHKLAVYFGPYAEHRASVMNEEF